MNSVEQAFVILSSEKNSRESGDKSLECAFHSLSLKRHLEAIKSNFSADAKLVFLPGAGALYTSGCQYGQVDERWLSLFVGEIENYSYLVKKYCLSEAGMDPTGSYLLETVRALSPLNDAEVVALLFKKLGPTFMSKVRGTFAFVVYDAQVGRLLAVNDCIGTNNIWQGHVDADNILAVSCNSTLVGLELSDKATIGPGEYKFGWRAAPLAYMASQATVKSRCNEAMQAAMAALESASGSMPGTASAPIPSVERRRSHTINLSASNTPPWGSFSLAESPNSSGFGGLSHNSSQRGSYIPPHRRSQGFGSGYSGPQQGRGKRFNESRSSYSGVSGSWRRSVDVYRPPRKIHDQRSSTSAAPLWRPRSPESHNHSKSFTFSQTPPRSTQADSETVPERISSASANTDSSNIVASSLLFQRARMPALAPPQPIFNPCPSKTGSSTSASSQEDTEKMIRDPLRSNPIPITHLLDHRLSTESDTPAASQYEDKLGLIEKKDIGSSLESLMTSSDLSTVGLAHQSPAELVRPSSLMFQCSDAGSSFGTPQPAGTGLIHASSSASDITLRPSNMHAPSKRLSRNKSGLVGQSREVVSPDSTAKPRTLSPHRESCEVTNAGNQCPPELSAETSEMPPKQGVPQQAHESSPDMSSALSPNGTHRDVSTQAAASTGMVPSGSFSDTLALLLRCRSPKTVRKISPSVSHNSVLSLSCMAPVTASNTVDDGAAAPEREAASKPAHQASEGTQEACTITVERPGHTLHKPASQLHPVLESLTSVSAGVAWQCGDRLIPPPLLQELSGGSEATVEEQRALASLLYSSPCSVCIVDVRDDKHPVVYVNSLFEWETGYSAQEVIGRNCRFLQAPPNKKIKPSFAAGAIHRAITLGRSYCGTLLNFAKDGSPLWNQLSIVPVRTKSLAVTHYIGMQNFTKVDVCASAQLVKGLGRRSSHDCLSSLQDVPVKVGVGSSFYKRSSSHQVLSSLDPDLVSEPSAAVHGCLRAVFS